jgi:hypothetical protein
MTLGEGYFETSVSHEPLAYSTFEMAYDSSDCTRQPKGRPRRLCPYVITALLVSTVMLITYGYVKWRHENAAQMIANAPKSPSGWVHTFSEVVKKQWSKTESSQTRAVHGISMLQFGEKISRGWYTT